MAQPPRDKPKLGLALSGASSRSVFYIGFLEVMQEQGVKIDYISAMSAGSVVAASFACGTMEDLKKLAFSFNKEFLFGIIEKSKGKGGIYNMDRVEETLRVYTRNLRFEDVHPLMGFVTTDVNRGEEVVLSMGDIARAAAASCALPGIFEPVKWGNRSLIDGGLVNVVPGNVAQQAGMDLVIGIHLRTTLHIFSAWQIALKRALNFLKRLFLFNQAERAWHRLTELIENNDYFRHYPAVEQLYDRESYPGIFTVLGRSLDIAIEAQKKHDPNASNYNCDMLIVPEIPSSPQWKRYLYLHFADFSNARALHELGRKTALEYLPKIWQMMADWEDKQMQANESIKTLLEQKL